jgi:hypothetical protein
MDVRIHIFCVQTPPVPSFNLTYSPEEASVLWRKMTDKCWQYRIPEQTVLNCKGQMGNHHEERMAFCALTWNLVFHLLYSVQLLP